MPARFDFFSLDKSYVMAVARGPLCDAISSYQHAAWKQSPFVQKRIEYICPVLASCFSFASVSLEEENTNLIEGPQNDNGLVLDDLPAIEFKTIEQLLPESLRTLL